MLLLQQSTSQPAAIHPAVCRFIGKAPPGTPLLHAGRIKQEAPEGNMAPSKGEESERIGQLVQTKVC